MKIELTVAYVEFGGNIGNGKYFYSYKPDVILVKKPNTELDFVFSSATADNFSMIEIASTDANNQLVNPTKAPNARSLKVNDVNDKPQLTLVSILVEDKARNAMISCDPQVLNIPD